MMFVLHPVCEIFGLLIFHLLAHFLPSLVRCSLASTCALIDVMFHLFYMYYRNVFIKDFFIVKSDIYSGGES